MWSFFSKDPSKELANFDIQENIALDIGIQQRTIWNLNNAKKKGSATNNDQSFSAYTYITRPGNETWLEPAKNCIKRMKMLRHPCVLMFQDGVENEKTVQIVTERVQPLFNYLNESTDNESQKMNEISWGLHQIATALSFLNNDCKLVHNNVNISSIVVNRAGDWKLASFEFTHSIDDQNIGYKVLTSLDCYEPPEKNPSNNLNTNRNRIETKSTVDSFGLGCLIWEIFNGLLPNASALKSAGKIPKSLVDVYRELINSNPKNRLSPSNLTNVCRQGGGFMNNHFVDTLLFLEQIQIKDQSEKTKFFTDLTEKLDDFPRNLCLFKILPELLNAYEFGNAGSSVLPPLFKLGKFLDETEYQKKIIPIVVKLFSSTDRATRMRLLQQLHLFIEHLSAGIINDQIFPNICQGFSDNNPTIRENTIRAIVLLAPKLNYNNLNVELMKHFARLQGQDEQGMIRTNTTVCIGKIANFINPQLRQRILLSAFPKAMRDPYPLARLSGIVAFANTGSFYTLKDIASKVLPSLCMLTIDPEKDVRDEAFKTIKMYTQKLEKVSENPELALEMEKEVSSCNLDLKNETSWTSWAMTSLSAKVTGYKNKDKQPSVALNTQPLAQPVLNTNKDKQKSQKTTPEKITEKTPETIKPTTKIEMSSTNVDMNFNSGWGVDDDDWKDLDDDNELMEPLEPIAANNSLSNQNSFNSSKIELPHSGYQQKNNDWSDDWADSFEPTVKLKNTTKPSDKKIDKTSKISPSAKLAPSSSYNWSNSNTKNTNSIQDEEDLFSSLVQDFSLNNNKSKLQSKTLPKNDSNDWNNDWSNLNDSPSGTNTNKNRKSKPLKLGQKKDIFS